MTVFHFPIYLPDSQFTLDAYYFILAILVVMIVARVVRFIVGFFT